VRVFQPSCLCSSICFWHFLPRPFDFFSTFPSPTIPVPFFSAFCHRFLARSQPFRFLFFFPLLFRSFFLTPNPLFRAGGCCTLLFTPCEEQITPFFSPVPQCTSFSQLLCCDSSSRRDRSRGSLWDVDRYRQVASRAFFFFTSYPWFFPSSTNSPGLRLQRSTPQALLAATAGLPLPRIVARQAFSYRLGSFLENRPIPKLRFGQEFRSVGHLWGLFRGFCPM